VGRDIIGGIASHRLGTFHVACHANQRLAFDKSRREHQHRMELNCDNRDKSDDATVPLDPLQHSVRRALVVENDLVGRELLARVLRQKGFEAQTAIGAAQAAAVLLAADFRYDLLLVDLNLEPVDGVELLRHLGSLPPNRKPGKIVVISNELAPYYARLSELQLELELFQKPLHLPSLMKVIEGGG
jgi:CheY-like chemotaxis protein